MKCKKCDDRVVLWAFSEGQCEICDIKVVTSHIPCHKVCNSCAEKHNLCEQCGESINGDGEVRPRSDEPSNP